VRFTDHGEMLPRGTPSDQDLSVATGSVIQHAGHYHILYTGYNSPFRRQGKPEQGVMHAVSDDLLTWNKIPGDTFFAPQDRYERDDWRDPFVFWNNDAREYWMLVAARLRNGPSRRRGCTALCVSKDLTKWEVREPFWAPELYFTHECPDLFQIEDWWYLVFSEFSERMQTRYRMSRNITGPWHAPEDDTFDGRALYAAKTCSNGRDRFLLGWNPTRANEKDSSRWQWGGNLVVHELVQQSDGRLSVKIPQTIDEVFSSRLPLLPQPAIGRCEVSKNGITIVAPESFGAATLGSVPERVKIEATLEFTEGTRGCGLILHWGEDLDSGYYIRLEPLHNRLVFDKWPRPGDVPFMIELERTLTLKPGRPIELKVVVDDTIGEVYVAGQIAMSTRMYDMKQRKWGVFANEGTTKFRNLGAFSVAQ
jgi:beta-fructofuranosidase